MVNRPRQLAWALTCQEDTPRGMSVMAFQSSSSEEGRPSLIMGWHHLIGCSFRLNKKDQRGSQLITGNHLCFLMADVMAPATWSSHHQAFPAITDGMPSIQDKSFILSMLLPQWYEDHSAPPQFSQHHRLTLLFPVKQSKTKRELLNSKFLTATLWIQDWAVLLPGWMVNRPI